MLAVQTRSSSLFLELLLAAGKAMGPVIRRFFSLGLNRVWLNAGDTAYRYAASASTARPAKRTQARYLQMHMMGC